MCSNSFDIKLTKSVNSMGMRYFSSLKVAVVDSETITV